jgi:hypothetical protein
MSEWTFLTNHACALVLISRDPDARLRDLAIALDVTERTAYGIVADLTEGGYLVKEKEGRRNRYRVQAHLGARDPIGGGATIGQVLEYSLSPGGPSEIDLTAVSSSLRDRDLIGQAQGMLMEREGITADEAFELMRSAAQRMSVPMRDIAHTLVLTGEAPVPAS